MSGDVQVRRRKNKNKRKGPAAANQSSEVDNITSDEFAVEEVIAKQESKNGISKSGSRKLGPEQTKEPSRRKSTSAKETIQSPARNSVSEAGWCAKLLLLFLISALLILGGLIFVYLRPDMPVKVDRNLNEGRFSPPVMENLPLDQIVPDLASIQEQIVSDEEIEKLTNEKMHKEVEVNVPDEVVNNVPVKEPLIVKEEAWQLGQAEEVLKKNGNEQMSAADSDLVDEEIQDVSEPYMKMEEAVGGVPTQKEWKDGNKLQSFEEVQVIDDFETRSKSTPAYADADSPTQVVDETQTKNEKKRKSKRKKLAMTEEELLATRNLFLRSERLMEAILEMSPSNLIVAELRPHLDSAKQALMNNKLEGLEETANHILLILEDVYVRLADAKERGTGINESFDEVVREAEKNSGLDISASSVQIEDSDQETPLGGEAETPNKNVIEDWRSQTEGYQETCELDDADGECLKNRKNIKDAASLKAENEKTRSFEASRNDLVSDTESTKELPVRIAEKPYNVLASVNGPAGESSPKEPAASSTGGTSLEELTEEDFDNSLEEDSLKPQLRDAENLIHKDPAAALKVYNTVLSASPQSVRALLGRARSLDALADLQRSNTRLDEALATYKSILSLAEEQPVKVGNRLLRAVGDTLVDKLRFRGRLRACARVQQRLLRQFPFDVALRNQLGITYLLQGQPKAAEEVFNEVLKRWPESGLAQVHLGFILKTTYANYSGGARFLQAGIASKEPGTLDARFYFHLGDALHRMGDVNGAKKTYEEAAALGLFLRSDQRSLYNVDHLTARPVWTLQQTTYQDFLSILKANWRAIRDEGMAALRVPVPDGFQPESENLKDTGSWSQFELFARGRKNAANCLKTPKTCAIIENFPPAAGCKRGQTKFSVMKGGTHVWAHCGPTNCRLRAHLGLIVPQDPAPEIRVVDTYLRWTEGELFVFDDSFEHEVWHNSTQDRLVLIVDLWHPDLTAEERKLLSPV